MSDTAVSSKDIQDGPTTSTDRMVDRTTGCPSSIKEPRKEGVVKISPPLILNSCVGTPKMNVWIPNYNVKLYDSLRVSSNVGSYDPKAESLR